jgi:hypothetical protein
MRGRQDPLSVSKSKVGSGPEKKVKTKIRIHIIMFQIRNTGTEYLYSNIHYRYLLLKSLLVDRVIILADPCRLVTFVNYSMFRTPSPTSVWCWVRCPSGRWAASASGQGTPWLIRWVILGGSPASDPGGPTHYDMAAGIYHFGSVSASGSEL